MRRVDADAVLRLAILRIPFAADGGADSRGREQVALVRCVEKHLRVDIGAVVAVNPDDSRAVLGHAMPFGQPVPAENHDTGLSNPVVENLLCDVWLEPPQSRVLAAAAEHLLEPVSTAIAIADAAIEFQGQTAHSRAVLEPLMVVDIGAAKAFDAHTADVLAGLHEHDPLPHRRHLHGGDDSRARPAVDADVGFHQGG